MTHRNLNISNYHVKGLNWNCLDLTNGYWLYEEIFFVRKLQRSLLFKTQLHLTGAGHLHVYVLGKIKIKKGVLKLRLKQSSTLSLKTKKKRKKRTSVNLNLMLVCLF